MIPHSVMKNIVRLPKFEAQRPREAARYTSYQN